MITVYCHPSFPSSNVYICTAGIIIEIYTYTHICIYMVNKISKSEGGGGGEGLSSRRRKRNEEIRVIFIDLIEEQEMLCDTK